MNTRHPPNARMLLAVVDKIVRPFTTLADRENAQQKDTFIGMNAQSYTSDSRSQLLYKSNTIGRRTLLILTDSQGSLNSNQ